MKTPQNRSENDDDGSTDPRQRHKNTWESRSRFQDDEAGKLLVYQCLTFINQHTAGYLDLLGRQNYWDPSFGSWPTHTVSKYQSRGRDNFSNNLLIAFVTLFLFDIS